MRVWIYTQAATDGLYVQTIAHLTLSPPDGTDIDDFVLNLDPPDVREGRATLVDWAPKEQTSTSISGSGSINTSNAAISLGAGFGFSGATVAVDAAGPTATESARWQVDIADFSSTASNRVSFVMGALWRCAPNVPVEPPRGDGFSISIQIDDWGFDTTYFIWRGQLLAVEEVFPALGQAPSGNEPVALVVPPPIWAVGQSPLRVRAVIGSVDALSAVTALASAGGAQVPLKNVKAGIAAGRHYLELQGDVEIDLSQTSVMFDVQATVDHGPSLSATAQPIAVARKMGVGSKALIENPGRHAFRIVGDPGTPFHIALQSGWSGRCLLASHAGGRVLWCGTGEAYHGVLSEVSPILVVDVFALTSPFAIKISG